MMKDLPILKRRRFILLFPLLVLLAGCAAGESDPPAETKTESPSVQIPGAYYTSCVNCHGDNLQGGYGPPLKNVGRNFSKSEMESILDEGIGKMPAQRQIPKKDREELVEWLMKLQ